MRKQIETEGEQTVGQNQKNTQEPDMNQLRKVRREKLAELQQNGRDPFQITKFNQTHHSLEVKDLYEAHEAEILKDHQQPNVEGMDEEQAKEMCIRDSLVDQRSHGQSEGKYIGFGCKDRYDAYRWIEWVIGQEGENVQILLHGNSMGGATVLMASGLDLPQQVKGIIADCPFTSPKAVFTHVLHSMYHLPAFPIIQIADAVNKKQAGYGLDAVSYTHLEMKKESFSWKDQE